MSEICSNCEIFNTGRSMELISANLTLFLTVLSCVEVRRCPHSGVGRDFLLRRRVTLTKTAVTRKRKVEKWIQRCQIDRLREGYKRAIDEIRGPIAKNGLSGKNAKILGKKKMLHFLTLTMFRPRPGNVVQRKKYRFTK